MQRTYSDAKIWGVIVFQMRCSDSKTSFKLAMSMKRKWNENYISTCRAYPRLIIAKGRRRVQTLLHYCTTMYLVKYVLKWYVLCVWSGNDVALSLIIILISIFAQMNWIFVFCKTWQAAKDIKYGIKLRYAAHSMTLELQYMQ